MTTQPHFAIYENSLTRNAADMAKATGTDYFSHFEIQTVRLYEDPGGERFFEPCFDEESCDPDHPDAAGPVLFGVYGKLNTGGAEHIIDYETLEEAQQFLSRIGIQI